jgi:small subunit ribosomal protein S8
MNDTISDLLVRIANAQAVEKETVFIPYSKVKENILNVLKSEGYIADFSADKEARGLTVELKTNIKPFEKIRRISKPGKRVYVKSKDIPRPKGYGTVIISTPKGVLSGNNARKSGLGGEIICEVF